MREDCLKLTTYFGERDRSGERLQADVLLDVYGRHRVQTSVLLRGIEGFGPGHRMHTDQLLSLSEDLPIVSVAVDTRERIEALLPEVLAIKQRGLLTLERARLLSGVIGPADSRDEPHEATKLTVYVGRQERVRRTPAFIAVCDLMFSRGMSGATVLLGVDGTTRGERARAAFFSRNASVPMMIIAVGPGDQIARVVRELDGLLQSPILTLERVRVCKRDGQLLAEPHALPGTDEHGLAVWQKLMIHTNASSEWNGHPLHRALISQLRRADVAGVTTLSGMWGFHGARPPTGDKLFQLRRHVPALTVLIERPERIARAFSVIDELTSESGLVTSEMVPAATAITGGERRGGTRLARHRF